MDGAFSSEVRDEKLLNPVVELRWLSGGSGQAAPGELQNALAVVEVLEVVALLLASYHGLYPTLGLHCFDKDSNGWWLVLQVVKTVPVREKLLVLLVSGVARLSAAAQVLKDLDPSLGRSL